MRGKAKLAVVVALTSVFLTAAYILFGYTVCANLPFVTEQVAAATADAEGSPFEKQQLIESASAIREYSFGSNDIDALYDAVSSINSEASTPYASYSHERLRYAPEQYTITEDQISHLDDVHMISQSLILPIFGVIVTTIFLILVGNRMFGPIAVARSLKASGIATAAIIVVIGLFALISFQGFFSYFHTVFFESGTWTFSADSLLIRSLPEAFWASMAAIWGCTSLAVGILSLLLGLLISKRTGTSRKRS